MRLASREIKRVLVTGGAGFIGAAVVRALTARPDVRVVTLDALTYAGARERVEGLPRHRFVRGDVRERSLVLDLLREEGIETILHLAAESHVDRSISGPDPFVSTNVMGTHELLEAARQVWLVERVVDPSTCRLVQVSTDEVYGDLEPGAPPSREGDPVCPSSPYSASKAAADHLVYAWHRTFGLPTGLTHGSNTYGAEQYPEKLLPVVVRAAVEGRPIPVYGDGQQVRDWLHVDDHAAGILAVAERGSEGRAYNLGANNPWRNLALVQTVCGVLDELRPTEAPHARLITRVDDRPGHDRRYALDSRRAAEELGWAPQVAFERGLREVVTRMVGR